MRRCRQQTLPATSFGGPDFVALAGQTLLLEALLDSGEIRRHGSGDLAGIGRPIGRVRGQAALSQLDQLGIRPAAGEPGRRPVQAGLHRLEPGRSRVRGDVGRLTCEDLAEDSPQAEHIRAAVHVRGEPAGLLRRHVGPGPQHAAGLGMIAQLGPGIVVRAIPGPLFDRSNVGAGEHLGQAPVHHLHLTEAADHHVGRLEVAVDDTPGVGVGHRLADLLEDPQEARQVLRRIGPLLQDCLEGPPLDQFHGEVGPTIGEGPQFVHRDCAGVLELARDPRFHDEPSDQRGLIAVPLEQDLDSQVAAQGDVAALEDGPHATAGDLAEEMEPWWSISGAGPLARARSDYGPGRAFRLDGAREGPGHHAERRGRALPYRGIVFRAIRIREPTTRQAAEQAVERPLAGRATADVLVDPPGVRGGELVLEEVPEGRLIRARLVTGHHDTPLSPSA